ncbi:MAG: hypothetical protein M1820_000462 [Bogoriella megaspora]|nr:MAG: hypothetical protein M1820_000462 [Bogoriella megaspora]
MPPERFNSRAQRFFVAPYHRLQKRFQKVKTWLVHSSPRTAQPAPILQDPRGSNDASRPSSKEKAESSSDSCRRLSISAPSVSEERKDSTPLSTPDEPSQGANIESDISSELTTSTPVTVLQSQEDFSTYQYKIRQLAADIGLMDIENVWRIKGGSFNRIVAVQARISDAASGPTKCIFRIPRDLTMGVSEAWTPRDPKYGLKRVEGEILDYASNLAMLEQYDIPIPRVLAYDTTPANAIQSPYTLEEFIEGTRLDAVFKYMSETEKLAIAEQVANLLCKIERIRFRGAGMMHQGIWPTPLQDAENAPFLKRSIVDQTPVVTSRDCFFTSGDKAYNIERMTNCVDGVEEYLRKCIEQLIFYVSRTPHSSWETSTLQRAEESISEMRELGFFSAYTNSSLSSRIENPPNVLYHWDLEPRNILVTPLDSPDYGQQATTWKVTAILDWDGLCAYPPVLTRRPPMWLWHYDHFNGKDASVPFNFEMNYDFLPKDWFANPRNQLSATDERIKTHFEQTFVEQLELQYPGYTMSDYQEDAYGKGRWIRRLARFAQEQTHNSQTTQQLQEYVDHWDRYYARVTGKERKDRIIDSSESESLF